MSEATYPVPRRNLGDTIRDAALIGGILAGVHAAGNIPGKPDDGSPPVVLENPSKSYVEAIRADRMRAERLR